MRDTDWRHLHPAFRAHAEDLAAKARVLGLQMYEGARSPQRQAILYAKGRTAEGKIVTHAEPFESFHNYGLAADFVFVVNGRWTWEEPRKGLWAEFRRIVQGAGLRGLSFEIPHVELPVSLADLKAGRYPVGGDGPWEDWFTAQIEGWAGWTPPAPVERPPLEYWEGLPPSPFVD